MYKNLALMANAVLLIVFRNSKHQDYFSLLKSKEREREREREMRVTWRTGASERESDGRGETTLYFRTEKNFRACRAARFRPLVLLMSVMKINGLVE
jgi:hypothetical protein